MALDAQTIVEAGLGLLQREGISGVTFRNLTADLGVRAPAIYWRFDDKQALLDAMAEAILLQRFSGLMPYTGDGPVDAWLVDLCRRLRLAMLAYPDGARVVTGASPLGAPTLGRIAEYALRACDDAAIAPEIAASVVFTALHFTFGRVIEEQSSGGAERLDADDAARFAAEFPTVARLLRDGLAGGSTASERYDAGLALIIRLE
jgi:TetR/AcrR family tetracycline transcriptional repressor